MTITIRAARAADAPAVLSLWLEAETHATTTDDMESVGALIAHDPGALIVAESEGGLVGSVIAGWDGWRGSIYRLAVRPAERRSGLGRALVDEAERHLLGRGARRLQAAVVSDDGRAMGFWRHSGWDEQRNRTRFVRNGAPPE
jgi:ribosomal protein S18 acetylase RimI-like enzyme